MAEVSSAHFRVRHIANLLGRHRYLFGAETHLQEAIAGVLTEAGEIVTRESILDRKNRADLRLPDGILIEVKVDGSLPAALRQCDRYSALPTVAGIVLVSTVSWARRALAARPHMSGKPFAMVHLRRQSL